MDERSVVADRLRRKRQEISGLEDKLRAAKIYVQALEDVMKVLGGPSEAPRPDSVLKAGSAVSVARDAILQAGAALHIGDLILAVGREDTREARASVGGALAAYVRRGEIFTRPAPNTFGLIELGHANEASAPDEPPPGFGDETPTEPEEDEPF